jgi:phage terminase large subunit-like protein
MAKTKAMTRSSLRSASHLYPGLAEPRFATLRNLDNPTHGSREAAVAHALRRPYLPWQQYVADVLGEVDPKTGKPIYRDGIITVPRQQGKTTIILVKKTYRAFGFGSPQMIRFTAQTKLDAIDKLREHRDILKDSPAFRRRFTFRDTNGQEGIHWNNGSKEILKSTTTKAGHGASLDLMIISEAFAQVDNRLEESARPTMLARPMAQMLVESTAGNATSIYFNELVRMNRERLAADPFAPSRTAYFDWSAPDDADPADPAVWQACMPALGHTIDLADVQHEFETATSMRSFKRSYLNIADRGEAEQQIVDPNIWADLVDPTTRIAGEVFFALDITPDRSWSSVGIAGRNDEQLEHVGLIKHDRGTHWVVEYVVEKMRSQGATTLYVQANKQAALLREDFERAGIDVVPFSVVDTAAACASIYDAILEDRLRFRPGQLALDIALAGTVWSRGDARVFDRAKSTTVIAPLYAITLARWAWFLAQQADYDVLDSIA